MGIPSAYVQMTYGISSAHAQWFSHGKSRADDHVTMIDHAIWGGKYIRRAHSGFRAVVWVSGTAHLGLSSH